MADGRCHPRKENPNYHLALNKNNELYWKRKREPSPVLVKEPKTHGEIVEDVKSAFIEHHLRKTGAPPPHLPGTIKNMHPDQEIITDEVTHPETEELPTVEVESNTAPESDTGSPESGEETSAERVAETLRRVVTSRAFMFTVAAVSFVAVTAVVSFSIYRFIFS